LVVIVLFELEVLEIVCSFRLRNLVAIQIDKCPHQCRVAFLNWLVSITYKFRILLLSLLRLEFRREPRLLLLVGIEILSVPAVFDFGNIGRPSFSISREDYLSLPQLMPVKNG
jgi:hypothetical protein